MAQPRPWVKVMKKSSSTFPQTHIFFVPNIQGLAATVLTREAKVVAAAAAAVVDEAATNLKHKVTPDRGDLMRYYIENPRVWANWQWNSQDCYSVVLYFFIDVDKVLLAKIGSEECETPKDIPYPFLYVSY